MSNIKELIRDEIRKWQSNIEAKCPESTSSRNYTKEEWNAIYEYNAYTRILSFLDTLPDEPVTDCHDLAEAKEEYLCKARRTPGHEWMTRDIEDAFKAGAEWQKKQIPMPEDTVIFQKGVEEGKRLMMEGAVEGFIFQSEDYYPKQLIAGYYGELGMGDKVKIIIVKEGEQ